MEKHNPLTSTRRAQVAIDTPRGKKRLHYGTGLRAIRQIAERYEWQLIVNRGQVQMKERQHAHA